MSVRTHEYSRMEMQPGSIKIGKFKHESAHLGVTNFSISQVAQQLLAVFDLQGILLCLATMA